MLGQIHSHNTFSVPNSTGQEFWGDHRGLGQFQVISFTPKPPMSSLKITKTTTETIQMKTSVEMYSVEKIAKNKTMCYSLKIT